MGMNILIMAFLLIVAGMAFNEALKVSRVGHGWPAAAAMLVLGSGIVAVVVDYMLFALNQG